MLSVSKKLLNQSKYQLPSRNDKKITLETDNTPGTKVIFLVDDNSNCYGPLEWELFDSISNTILLKKISSEIESYKLPEEFLNKIDLKDLLEFSFYDSDTSVVIINKVSNLSIFLYNLKSYFDYSSDQEIIGFFTKINTKNMPVNEITLQIYLILLIKIIIQRIIKPKKLIY